MKRFFLLCGVFMMLGESRSFALGPSDSDVVFHIGPGFLVGGGPGEPGVGLIFAKKWGARSFYFGLDTAVFFRTDPNAVVTIPLLPMIYYRFGTQGDIIPTLGFEVGPVLAAGAGSNALDFMVMLNPGFQFYLDPNIDFFFRSSLGIIGSRFVYYPQLGLTFRL